MTHITGLENGIKIPRWLKIFALLVNNIQYVEMFIIIIISIFINDWTFYSLSFL